MTESQGNRPAPLMIYETRSMTPEQVAKQNADYAAAGVPVIVIDVRQYCGKLERQADGNYKRVRLPKCTHGNTQAQGDSE